MTAIPFMAAARSARNPIGRSIYDWPWAPHVDFSEPTLEDQPLTFTVTADNDCGPDYTPRPLAFEKVSGPGSINPVTGECTWLVPYNTPVSTVEVTLRVRDGSQGANSYHDVVVPMAITRCYQTPSYTGANSRRGCSQVRPESSLRWIDVGQQESRVYWRTSSRGVILH